MSETTWTQDAGMSSPTEADNVENYSEQAEASKDAAAASATAAATSATNSANSATLSQNQVSLAAAQATLATNQATAAASSATASASSAATAGTAETDAVTAKNSAETAKTGAETAQTAAETAKAAAETAQTAAETAETNAETSETNASTSATAAATSATAAAGSATSSSTSATNAATSATASETSKVAAVAAQAAAETAKTGAETAQTAAETAETNAETAESNASASATAAATSATAASSSASGASTSATEAASSATAASGSATAASGSAFTAASEATAAAGSATAASASASSASAAQTAAETAETNAETAETGAQAAQTAAETAETNAETAETNAAASASAASGSAASAASSATAASGSATAAAGSASAASTSASDAAAALDEFTDLYLGSKGSDPTLDNDGNALQTGALYHNNSDDLIKFYNGSAWVAAYATLSGAMIATNNLSDVSSVSAARTNLGLGTAQSPSFNNVTVQQDPTTNLQLATKQYVDTIAAAGLHYHDPVRVEAPSALTVTYNNGSSGVGATLTNAGTQAALAIDGITLQAADRVLIYTQTDSTQNGVYTVTNVGSGSTNWVMTRSTDTDSYAPSDPDSFGEGDAFFVLEGNTGAGELYVMNTSGTVTFGTTNITFTHVASTAVYTAAGGLGLTGTVFSHADTSSQATVNNSGGTVIQDVTLDTYGHVTGLTSHALTASDVGAATSAQGALADSAVQINDTPTFGTTTVNGNVVVTGTVDGRDVAADGSKLDGIEAGAKDDQTITAGSGLSGGGTGNVTLSHADTSSVSSSNNSGNTFIQDLTFDTYGHVTAVGTGSVSVGNGTLTVQGTGALGGSGTFTANQSSNATISISHDDTSSQGSVNNSGATVIQDVTLDGYGHVTALGSHTLTLANLGYTGATDANNYSFPYTVSASASNSTVVQRHSSGYIYANYFNTSPNDIATGSITKIVAESGNDGFMRHASADAVRSFINVANGANNYSLPATPSVTGVNIGSQINLAESADRADLLQITSSTSGWAGLQIRNSSNEGRWSFMTDGSSAGLYDDENGDWAVQMAENGGVTLSANGTANFTTGTTYMEMARNLDMNNYDIYGVDQLFHHGDTNTYMQFHAADQWRVVVAGSERLEVKNSSPHVLVSGDLNSTSDERLKDNIEPIENALSDVCKLEGVSFNWKDTGTKATGFIAQQVEPIFPDLVNTSEDDGIKSVNYIGLIGHLVEAIKEQQAQIGALTAKLNG